MSTPSVLPNTPRFNASKVISITPTISTSPAYSSGDQLGGIMTLPDAVRQDLIVNYGISELVGVTILDGSKQDSPIDIWFFNQSPTITSTDNAPFAMTAANQALQCIGVVQLGASGLYSDAASVSVCSNQNLNKVFKIPGADSWLGTTVTNTSIYAIAVVRGTPTYSTTTSLQFQFEFFLD